MMRVRETARGARTAHIALFDATTLVARGVKEQLVARGFPTASVRLFTSSDDPEANLSEFDGEAMLVGRPDLDALGNLDIAFLCGTPEEGARYLQWPRQAGFTAIDLTAASRGDAHVPVVNAAVNPGAIEAWAGLIAAPSPAAQILTSLIAPIRRGPGLESATAVIFRPASESGVGGVDELYQQTVAVLNFHDLPKQVFGRQLAFNLIPLPVADPAPARSSVRDEVEDEVLRVTGSGYDLAVQTILAPVFHCHAAALHIVLPPGHGPEDLIAALRTGEDLKVPARSGGVTPVERAGAAEVAVAGVRPSRVARGAWIWAVADHLTAGTARNAVRIAEGLMDRNLARRPS